MPLNDQQKSMIANAIELLDEASNVLNHAKLYYSTAGTTDFYVIQDAERWADQASSRLSNMLNL